MRVTSKRIFGTVLLLILAASVLAAVGVAHNLNGGASIATAPTVVVGQQEFGNTTNGSWANNQADFWKLPLIAADQVVVDWSSSSDSNNNVYANKFGVWPAGTTDFSINNESEQQEFNIGSNDKAESLFTANKTGVFPIMFFCYCGHSGGPYSFTAYVKHVPVLSFPGLRSVAPGAVVTIAAHYADGTPISDKHLQIKILGRWNGKTHLLGGVAPTNGRAAIKLALPPSLRGSSIGLTATATGRDYLARHTATRLVHVR